MLFIDARKLGTMLDRVHRDLTANDAERIAGTYHAWRGDSEASEVVVNDPGLVQRLGAALKRGLGDAVGPIEPTSASEDFGVYGRVAGAPSVQLRIGASDPAEFAKAREAGTLPPGPHNSGFAPVREPTIRAGVSALTLSALELLGNPRERG